MPTFPFEHREVAKQLGYSQPKNLRRKIIGKWTTDGHLVEGTHYVIDPPDRLECGQTTATGSVLFLTEAGLEIVHQLAFGRSAPPPKSEEAVSKLSPSNVAPCPAVEADPSILLHVVDRALNLLPLPDSPYVRLVWRILLEALPQPLRDQMKSEFGFGPAQEAPNPEAEPETDQGPDPSAFIMGLKGP